jgi:hypothetical protein
MEGTFTFDQVTQAIQQGIEAGITNVYFEGGEPFLYYPLMVESLRYAKSRNLECGIVTNCYWANSENDAELWLKPLVDIGIDDLSVSNDSFHSDDPTHSPAQIAYDVARRLGLPAGSICIEAPTVISEHEHEKGEAVVGGGALFKGRAVEKLLEGQPRKRYDCFTECTSEDLTHPSRIHLDPFGNVFVCQGLSIGNIWQKPLREIMNDFEPSRHPVIGPLVEGGPAKLVEIFGLPDGDSYVSECHLCYLVRKRLIDRFPDYLCPKQVYGESE